MGAGGNTCHNRRPPGLGKNLAREIGPACIGRTAEMIETARMARHHRPPHAQERRRDIRGRCWPADLVLDHGQRIARLREAQHGFHEIAAMRRKHPRGAQDRALAACGAHRLLACQLGAAIGIAGGHRIERRARGRAAAVKHVIGRNMAKRDTKIG